MARPDKIGMEYYPKDIDADQDDKLGMIIGEFGLKGEVLFDKLCGWIYKHEGYYVEWEESVQLKFLRRYDYCGFSVSFLNEVVPRFVKWGLFDKSVFNTFQILTSTRIQKTWLEATRKRKDRKYLKNIWLLEVNSDLQAEEMPKKTEETPQKKLNKNKEEESKVKGASALVVAGDDNDAKQRALKKEYDKLIADITGKDLKIVWPELVKFIREKRPEFVEPYETAWNLFAKKFKLSCIESITKERLKKFKTRIGEPKFDFMKILEKIQISNTLRNIDTNGNWKVTFDFIIDSETNYIKIIEGQYK